MAINMTPLFDGLLLKLFLQTPGGGGRASERVQAHGKKGSPEQRTWLERGRGRVAVGCAIRSDRGTVGHAAVVCSSVG